MNTATHRTAEPNEDPRQWADPSEVVEAFVYLASDESKNVNGKRFRAQRDNNNHNDSNNYVEQQVLTQEV
jgi:NAD(P)-dependent dehydrogenase (short-subunit alcohol dehydrogenase family)